MIYDHKDKETLQKYSVRAFPTFVITDAEGTELMRQVGAPFSTPKEAIDWFTGVGDGLENLPKYKEAYDKDPNNVDAAIKLADTYNALGKGAEALELYEGLVEKIGKKDKRKADIQLKLADALMGTISRENQAEVGARIKSIYDEVLPGLIKAKDERAVEPAFITARIKAVLDKDYKSARGDLVKLQKTFPKHDRLKEMKFYAAMYAMQDGDNDTAKAEFEAMIKEGPEDDRWVKNAASGLERLKKAQDADK